MEDMIQSGADISSFIPRKHVPKKKTSLSPRKQKTPALNDHHELFKTDSPLHSIPESLDAESTQLAVLDTESTQLAVLDAKSTQLAVQDAKSTQLAVLDTESTQLAVLNAKSTQLAVQDAESTQLAVLDTESTQLAVLNAKEDQNTESRNSTHIDESECVTVKFLTSR